ncbi:hypothetical protein ZWY2020_000663 [Hordeum vulgare]|nr:hypothetical protein ZWY2020_000663 [Hordeum vulgare]
MAVTAGCSDISFPLSEARRHAPAPSRAPNLQFPVTPPPSRAASKLSPTSHDDTLAREILVDVAMLLAAAGANMAIAPTASAASGASMGGRSSSISSSSSSIALLLLFLLFEIHQLVILKTVLVRLFGDPRIGRDGVDATR